MRFRFSLPGLVTPSLNDFLNWNKRGLKWKFTEIKDEYFYKIIACFGLENLENYQVQGKTKRLVAFESYRKDIIRDRVNFEGGFKYLLDMLSHEKIRLIYDDNAKFCEDSYFQYRVLENFRTEILIEDI